MSARPADIEATLRLHGPAILASLIRRIGDFDLAEDGLQEAFVAALNAWPVAMPDNPRSWLARVARNKAVDQIRRRQRFRAKQADLRFEQDQLQDVANDASHDGDEEVAEQDLLALIFTCCHPALALESQVALTLRVVCSLPISAVARAFLVREEAMAQRLVRAKAKIRVAKIPYVVPAATQLPERIEGVLAVLYLVFTEAYAGEPRLTLSAEVIDLARRLNGLIPGRKAVEGLLALMLLHGARQQARLDRQGDLVLLEDQDRSLWNTDMIADGLGLVDTALRRPGRASNYAVQAAIAALHVQAPTPQETDWDQIVGLYDVLLRLDPTPVVALNRAAAVAMAQGPAAGLLEIERLDTAGELKDYFPRLAAKAELLRRMGQWEAARQAYRQAVALAPFAAERRLMQRRLDALGVP